MCIIDCLSTIVFILPLHLDYTKVIILILWWRNFQLEYWRIFQLVSTFKGTQVLIFDDVITRGFSYARFACALEAFGASVLGGFFLGRTLLK